MHIGQPEQCRHPKSPISWWKRGRTEG